jgi:hypothetical protein
MMEAARTSETSVDNYFTRQYIPEDNSELQVPFDLGTLLSLGIAQSLNNIHILDQLSDY